MPEPTEPPDLTGYTYVSETPPRLPGEPRKKLIPTGWKVTIAWAAFMCWPGSGPLRIPGDLKMIVLAVTLGLIALGLIGHEVGRKKHRR